MKRKNLFHRTRTTDYVPLVVALCFRMLFLGSINLTFHSNPLFPLSTLPPASSLNIWPRSCHHLLVTLILMSWIPLSLCPSSVPRPFKWITFWCLLMWFPYIHWLGYWCHSLHTPVWSLSSITNRPQCWWTGQSLEVLSGCHLSVLLWLQVPTLWYCHGVSSVCICCIPSHGRCYFGVCDLQMPFCERYVDDTCTGVPNDSVQHLLQHQRITQ